MTLTNKPKRASPLPATTAVADTIPKEYHDYWKQEDLLNMDGPAPERDSICNMDTLRKVALDHLDPELFRDAKVELFDSGAYNSLYSISSTQTSTVYLMRIPVPVDPFFKTESEVATMEYIRENTSLPVPNIIAYSSTMSNALGFEWVLMEKMNGVPYLDVRSKMPLESKMEVVEDLANGMAPILKEGVFPVFGSLYFDDVREAIGKSTDIGGGFVIGPMTSPRFTRDGRVLMAPDRGPFNTTRELMMAELDIVGRRLQNPTSPTDVQYEFDPQNHSEVLKSFGRLRNILPLLVSATDQSEDAKVLWHDDLNFRNILIDPQTFKLVGAIDWEMVAIIPAWEAEGFTPTFLQGRDVNEKPVRRPYEYSDNLIIRTGEWEDTLGRRKWSESIVKAQGPSLLSIPKDNAKTEIRDRIICFETDWQFANDWLDKQEQKVKDS